MVWAERGQTSVSSYRSSFQRRDVRLSPPQPWKRDTGSGNSLIDGLQLLAGLEAHRLAGRDVHLGAGTRVTADAGLARAYVEDAKASQFNAVAVGKSFLHALKDGFHRQLGLGLGDAGLVDHFVDNVQLDHEPLPVAKVLMLKG